MNDKILHITVGLPRSGKSTWAQTQNMPIVNPDAIRLALHGQRYLPDAETMVWAQAKYMVKALFLAGHDHVILDATNTTRARRDEWRSKSWKRRFHIISTPESVCLERADLTQDDCIKPVITAMAAKFEPINDDELET